MLLRIIYLHYSHHSVQMPQLSLHCRRRNYHDLKPAQSLTNKSVSHFSNRKTLQKELKKKKNVKPTYGTRSYV